MPPLAELSSATYVYLFWFLGSLHVGNHAPQVSQVPDTGPMPPYEGGPCYIGAVSRQKETLCWKLGWFTERLLVNHLLLFLLEFSGRHVDASFIVEGEARGRIQNIRRLHLRERKEERESQILITHVIKMACCVTCIRLTEDSLTLTQSCSMTERRLAIRESEECRLGSTYDHIQHVQYYTK